MVSTISSAYILQAVCYMHNAHWASRNVQKALDVFGTNVREEFQKWYVLFAIICFLTILIEVNRRLSTLKMPKGQPVLRNGLYNSKKGKKGKVACLQLFLTCAEILSFVRVSVVIFKE